MNPATVARAKSVLKSAAIAAPLTILLFDLATGGQLKDYLDKATVRDLLLRAADWGPGFMILAGIYMLSREYAPQIIAAQKSQAVAMADVASGSKSVQERHAEQADESREILINLRVLSQKIDELKEGIHGRG